MTQSRSGVPAVMHVAAPARYGGLETVVRALARRQAVRGLNVSVLLSVPMGWQLDPEWREFEAAGVPLRLLRLPPRAYLLEARRMREEFQAAGCGLVHTHGYRADLIGGRSARAAGARVLSTVHGLTGGDWKNRLYEMVQHRALQRADGVVAVSDSLGSFLRARGVEQHRIRVIRNAWAPSCALLQRDEARAYLGVPRDGLRIGWIGRMSREKGVDVLVRALADLSSFDWVASIVGDGPDLRTAQELAARLGIDRRITWHGALPHAARLLSAFDAVVISSRTEGTPMVLLEAASAGVPLVTTAVGGIPDAISQDEALLVPAEDPSCLARAVACVLERPDEARVRASRARARLSDPAVIESWVDAYQHAYREVLRRNGTAPHA